MKQKRQGKKNHYKEKTVLRTECHCFPVTDLSGSYKKSCDYTPLWPELWDHSFNMGQCGGRPPTAMQAGIFF